MSASSLSNSGQPGRHARRRHPDAGAAGVAGLAQPVHVGLQRRHVGHRREEWIGRHMVPALEPDRQLADLLHAAAKHSAIFFSQPLLGHGASGDHRRGKAGRGPAAAARVTPAVLLQVAVVGMAGAEGLRDLTVVLAALVGVADQQADRCSGRVALVHARQDLDLVGFLALGDVAAGAGTAPVQVDLDVRLGQRQAGRAAVDHAADRRSMRFAEVGDGEQGAEGVSAHGFDYSRAVARCRAAGIATRSAALLPRRRASRGYRP